MACCESFVVNGRLDTGTYVSFSAHALIMLPNEQCAATISSLASSQHNSPNTLEYNTIINNEQSRAIPRYEFG